MKMTTQHKLNRTKVALAVGVALFAVSELGFAVYEARTSGVIATADTAEAEDDPITIDVLANDGDANPTTLAIANQPTQGTVAISGGQVVYTPDEGFSGTDSFTYTVEENEWRTQPKSFALTVDSMPPIATSYPAEDQNGAPITVSIFDGTSVAAGPWNTANRALGDGVVGKSFRPSSTVSQLEGCNAGDNTGTPISLTMIWSGVRTSTQTGPGGNQFTITTDSAPTPVRTTGDGIVLQVHSNPINNVTSSVNGSGSFVDDSGSASDVSTPWRFTTTSSWSNLSASAFEALPITILASTYNSKTWDSSATSFSADVDYTTCALSSGSATVTITAKESSGGGGGGSLNNVAIFALGLFGLNALRRRRQA